jgi:hypothetical protein
LRESLIREWRQPSEDPTKPLIHIQSVDPSGLKRLYVVWEAWASLPQIERSAIIMDSYEAIHGVEDSLNVTVAMGLTRSEAERMGMKSLLE